MFGDHRAVLHRVDAVGDVRAPRRGGARRRRSWRADLSERTRANSTSISAASSTEVGSSSRMSRRAARPLPPSVSALASSTIWRAAKVSSEVRCGDVDVDADLGQLPPRRRIHGAPVDEAEAGESVLLAEIDVFGDRQVEHQRLFLEHHADAMPRRVARHCACAAARHRAGGCRHPAGSRRPARASASTCRRRSRRSARPLRSAGPRC